MATHIQKQVDKQKKEAERKFSSWFMSKFKKDKTQYLRDKDEKAADAERLRRQKAGSSASMTASASSSSLSSSSKRSASDGANMQRQQSFLRAQLLEMKRHSHEVLLHSKSRDDGHSSDEEYDDVRSVLGEDDEENNTGNQAQALNRPKSRTRMRRSLTASSDGNQSDNQTDDEDEEKKGAHTDDEGEADGGGSHRNSFSSTGGGSHRNSFTGGSQRNSVSDELERRSSRAALLYEEAISALEDVLHPEQATGRVRRSDSATRRLFEKPENEWI